MNFSKGDHSSPFSSKSVMMVSYTQLLLVILLGLTAISAYPKQVISGEFSLAASRYLDAFRSIMPCGYGQDMDVLAPYYIPSTNLRIEGLDSFELLSASDHGENGLVSYVFAFRKIQLLGSAEVEGGVKVGDFQLPFAWSGHFNDTLFDVRFVGNFSFASSSRTKPKGLRIVDFQQTIFLGDVDLNKRDFFWNLAVNYFFKTIQSQITKYYFQSLKIPLFNNAMEDYYMSHLISFLETRAQTFENIKCKA